MSEQYPSPARPVDQQFVGIDLHRRRSVIVRMDGDGRQLGVVRIVNDVTALRAEVGKAGPGAQVVVEATYGWVRSEGA